MVPCLKKWKYFIAKNAKFIATLFAWGAMSFAPQYFLPLSFPCACRKIVVTPKNQNNFFKPFVRTPKGPKPLQSHFDTDLCPFISVLWKRNSNSCSEGFKITVEKKLSKFWWETHFVAFNSKTFFKKAPSIQSIYGLIW